MQIQGFSFPCNGQDAIFPLTDSSEHTPRNTVLGGVCGYLLHVVGELSPFWSCLTGLSPSCQKSFVVSIFDRIQYQRVAAQSGTVCAPRCRLTGKMTGAGDQVSDCD